MSNTQTLSLCNTCNCMTKTIDGHCGKCEAGKPKAEWERTIKAWGWREAVAVVFRRLMPVVNLDESPPVKYLKTNEQLDLSGSEEDVAEIFRQTLTAFSKEVENLMADEREHQVVYSKEAEADALTYVEGSKERNQLRAQQRQALSNLKKKWGI